MRKKRKWKFGVGCTYSVVVFALVLGIFWMGMDRFLIRAQTENAQNLQESMIRACVQCYAIEGQYPPGVEYLAKYYGIWMDEDQYHVFYNGFASNLMPDIMVVPAAKEYKSHKK